MGQTYENCLTSAGFAQVHTNCPSECKCCLLTFCIGHVPHSLCTHTSGAYKCLDVAVMITRSELLESELPAPDICTSPSGFNQAEQPRQSHPRTVQAFDVAPAVQTYIDGLPATPERFKPIDYKNSSVSQSTVESVSLEIVWCLCWRAS